MLDPRRRANARSAGDAPSIDADAFRPDGLSIKRHGARSMLLDSRAGDRCKTLLPFGTRFELLIAPHASGVTLYSAESDRGPGVAVAALNRTNFSDKNSPVITLPSDDEGRLSRADARRSALMETAPRTGAANLGRFSSGLLRSRPKARIRRRSTNYVPYVTGELVTQLPIPHLDAIRRAATQLCDPRATLKCRSAEGRAATSA
jgi:hypothetical protein